MRSIGTHRIRTLAAAAAGVLVLLAGSAVPASAAGAGGLATAATRGPAISPSIVLTTPGQYIGRIRSTLTGKCIGISVGRAGDWTCTTGADQQWYVGFSTRSGYIQIQNDSMQCLAVNGGSTSNGARILGYSCTNPSDDEFWTTQQTGQGTVFVNLKSKKVIRIDGGSSSNGAALVLWDNNGSSGEGWGAY